MKNENKLRTFLKSCDEAYKTLTDLNLDVNEFEKERHEGEIEKLKELEQSRDEIIKTILSTMFKGNSVIIPNVLSLRNGTFRRYREQYALTLTALKDLISRYANHLIKISDEDLDLIEFALSFIREDYDNYYGRKKLSQRFNSQRIILKKTHAIFNQEEKTFSTFNEISLNADGVITFGDKENESYRNERNFDDEVKNILSVIYKKKVDKLKERFNVVLKEERIQIEKEIEQLKERGGKYLLVASLKEEKEK